MPRPIGKSKTANAHAMYSMEMPNIHLVRQGLQNLTAELPEVGLVGMYKMALRVKAYYAYTATNPPKREAYVRTFAMRKSRRILKEKFGYVFIMDPIDKRGRQYAAYVVGTMLPNSQAAMHKGRWIPLRKVVETERAKMPPEIQKLLGALVSRETAKANKK